MKGQRVSAHIHISYTRYAANLGFLFFMLSRKISQIRVATYSIEATELIAGHGDDDGDKLPTNSWILQQL